MIGTGTGTQSHGTVGTGTKICGTVPLLKSRGTTNPGISGQESRSVPGRSRCPGILRDANPAWSREAIYFSIKNRVWTVQIGPSIYTRLCPVGQFFLKSHYLKNDESKKKRDGWHQKKIRFLAKKWYQGKSTSKNRLVAKFLVRWRSFSVVIK